jgi:seryl-tRNA synthetase
MDEQKDLTQEEIRKALTAMHHGLLSMQARLDDHEKVIETMMLALENLTSGKVPDGFRQPKKGH